MRNLLLAALAVSSFPSLDRADACGFEMPQVLPLSSHSGPFRGGAWATRTFAMLGEPVPAGVRWHMLAPRTYDSTQVADAAPLDAALTVTLVGPSGARVVSTTQRAFLAPAWGWKTPSAALEVDTGERDARFSVALVGSHPNATWEALDHQSGSADDVDWVIAQGVTPAAGQVTVSHIPNTTSDVITVMQKDSGDMITFVRRDDKVRRQIQGAAVGTLTDRSHYLLVERDGVITPWFL
jgi:hypothetical protein